MKKRLLPAAGAVLCALGSLIHAQTTTITASNEKMSGVKIVAGTVTFTPVNTFGSAISFADATGSQNGPTAFACKIVTGAITGAISPVDGTVGGTCAVPDAMLTTPANILYQAQICDTSSSITTGGKCFTIQAIAGVSGTTWALDHYGPPTSTSSFQNLQVSQGNVTPGSCNSGSVFINSATPSWNYCVAGVYVRSGSENQRLGLIATRGDLTEFLNTGTWGMDRSFHIARQAVPALGMKIVWVNYYTTNAETAIPGTGTYKASVEYPAGVITACTFGGNATVTATGASTDTITDWCGPAIPRGAAFWVRMLYVNSAGVPYTVISAASPLDGFVFGSGTPSDLTGGGSVGTMGAFSMHPAAIIGMTALPGVCLVGDSRVVGLGDAPNDASADTGELARSIGKVFAYTKVAISGSVAQSATTNFTNRLRIIGYCSHVIDQYGINDLVVNSRTPAQIAGDRSTLAGLFARPTFGTTLPPEAGSTDSYATTTNQTTTGNTTAFNALVIAGIAGEVGYFDIDSVVDPLGINKWPVSKIIGATSGTAGFATVDGVHESTAMNMLIQQSGVVNTNWITR